MDNATSRRAAVIVHAVGKGLPIWNSLLWADNSPTHSAAEVQGLERVSKYPKSTKFGRQNPIAQRWNSEEQLVLWRKAWTDVTNLHLEQAGRAERIDHRSYAERGLDEQPTVHEGVVARALEKKGIVSDRCELNRQIKADNALLWELKAQMKKLAQAGQSQSAHSCRSHGNAASQHDRIPVSASSCQPWQV